jgi:hypothetical protein
MGCYSAALCLARQFTTNAMSGLLLFARYIKAPMTLRYGYSAPKTSFYLNLNRSVSFSKARTTMGVLRGYVFSILNFFNTF